MKVSWVLSDEERNRFSLFFIRFFLFTYIDREGEGGGRGKVGGGKKGELGEGREGGGSRGREGGRGKEGFVCSPNSLFALIPVNEIDMK